MKFFQSLGRRFGKSQALAEQEGSALRYPPKPFNGAVVPATALLGDSPYKAPRRFKMRQMTNGNFVLCRIGKALPAVGIVLLPKNHHYTIPVKLMRY